MATGKKNDWENYGMTTKHSMWSHIKRCLQKFLTVLNAYNIKF